MAQKTNPTLIGVFVVGAVTLAVTGLVFFGSGRAFKETVPFVLFFDSSIRGLDVGAPVFFRGVRVGSVQRIVLRYHTNVGRTEIPIYVELEPDRMEEVGARSQKGTVMPLLIKQGLRAQLALESFITGKLAIQLDFHPDKEIRLVGGDASTPEIPTIPSALEELQQTLEKLPIQELVEDLRSAVLGVNELVRSEELKEVLRSADAALDEYGKLAQDIDQEVKPLAQNLAETLESARTTLTTVDRKITTLESSMTEAIREYQALAVDVRQEIKPLSERLQSATDALRASLEQARSTLAAAETAFEKNSPFYVLLIRSLEEIESAARAIRELADLLERYPESVIQGKP